MALTARATGTPGGMVADAQELRRGLELLADPEGWCQVFALPSAVRRTLPGKEIDALINAVNDLPTGAGVYMRLNPVTPGLADMAGVSDVTRRRLLLIDVDALKEEGHKPYCSTDREKDEARGAADSVASYLSLCGWPAPIICDSGNGWYLVYRVEMENSNVHRKIAGALLSELDQRFADLPCEIDKAVASASSGMRLPGSWNRRGCQGGKPAEDRPYRMCRLVFVPNVIETVPTDLIVQTAALQGMPIVEQPPERNGKHGLTARATGSSHAYARAAIERQIVKLALAQQGGRERQLNDTAFQCGQWLGASGLDFNAVANRLYMLASGIGLFEDPNCGEGHVHSTVQRALAAGMEEAKDAPERNGTHKPAAEQPAPAAPSTETGWRIEVDGEQVIEADPAQFAAMVPQSVPTGPRVFQMYTLAGLLETEFPAPVWVVPGLLSEGLNILAGKPKMGKSMLALNLAITVAAGGKAMGGIQTEAGDVLYLSLEDRTRRIKTRAMKMLGGSASTAAKRLTIASTWPRQDQGGLGMIAWWLKRADNPNLVIVDVYSKFRPAARHGANQYEQDYAHLSPVKDMMDAHSCCGLVLMHLRKSASEDVMDEVSGTLGLTGAVDGTIVLQRARNNVEAKLHITGRDVADAELVIRFEPDTFTWKYLGTAEDQLKGEVQKAVIDYLKSLNGSSAFVNDIAIKLNKSPETIRTVISRLQDKKLVRRVGNAWAYPGEGLTDEEAF